MTTTAAPPIALALSGGGYPRHGFPPWRAQAHG